MFKCLTQLALKASQLLEQTKLSELRSNIARSLSELEMFTEDGENMDTPKRKSAIDERMEALVSVPLAVEDALVGLFDHSDHTLQRRVVETYVRRLYQVLIKTSVIIPFQVESTFACLTMSICSLSSPILLREVCGCSGIDLVL